MHIYADFGNKDEIFYYADKEENKFVNLNKEEFEKKFQCYENDLKKSNGIVPWKSKDKQTENLLVSSGNVIAGESKSKEGEER